MDIVKVILVDDDPNILHFLKQEILQSFSKLDICETCDTVLSAVKAIKKNKPQLIFLDIDLPDGNGFDVLEMTDSEKYSVIFTTASDAHAIKAFRLSAVDYLLKPIDSEELQIALEKVLSLKQQQRLDLLKENFHQYPSKIALNELHQIHWVDVKDIVRCESHVNYTNFHFINGKKIIVSKTLKEFDELLQPMGFFRVHQSHLLNLEYISTFHKQREELELTNGDTIPVASRKRTSLLSLLNTHKQ